MNIECIFCNWYLSVPCAPPSDIRAFNTSSTSLRLQWHPLSTPNCTRGILRSYVVFYTDNFNLSYKKITVPPTSTTLDITGLQKFTGYNISVAGQTSKGLGPLSAPIYISTAEDGKQITFSSFLGQFSLTHN